MKHGRFDSDYERIRRKPPPQSEAEFPEPSLFDREREQRRAAEREDFKRRMEVLAQQEREREEERAARADANKRASNVRALMAEYERAGVEPPFTNGDGVPTCSLSLLLQIGWSIEQLGDSVTLIQPRVSREKATRKRPDHRSESGAEETPPPETSA